MTLIIKPHRLLIVLSLALGACSSPQYEQLVVPPPTPNEFQLEANAGNGMTFNSEDTVLRWWEQYDDPQLTKLIDRALEHNNDIGVAMANVALARSLLDVSKLDKLPVIGSSAQVIDQRLANANSFPGQDQRMTTYNASFDASWEFDLFGRVSQRIHASQAELEASEAELDNAYVTVAAEVARVYLQLRGNQYRLSVNQRNADTLEQSYALIQEMTSGGLGNALDEQRAFAQWELVRSRIPGIEAQINILVNRLGVLTGQMPAALYDELITPAPLPDLPTTIAIGEPIELLKRRPDIRRTERLLAAALARYELSVAELYPAVNFSGSIGFIATKFASLGSGGTFTNLLAPTLSWQAFNLGRVQAQIAASDARIHGQLELFEKTVLAAFEEVNNSLTSLNHESQRRARLFSAAQASARAAGFAMERFESGADSYLDVLDAQRTQLEAEDQLVDSEMELALQLVSLYKALGGGWQVKGTPTT